MITEIAVRLYFHFCGVAKEKRGRCTMLLILNTLVPLLVKHFDVIQQLNSGSIMNTNVKGQRIVYYSISCVQMEHRLPCCN